MMKGSDIVIQEKKAKFFNEWERFTSTDGESIESYYHRFSELMNDFKRNKHFPEKIASNLKFLNNLQLEWSQHVTIVHQTKDLHTASYAQLYDFLKYHDPLALMANSNNPFSYLVFHQDQPSPSTFMQQPLPSNNYNPQPSFNQNYMQQPMLNHEDITDPTTVMNMELVLMAKAFKFSTPTNKSKRTSSNYATGRLHNQFRQYARQNVRNQVIQNVVQNPGVQKVGNQNRLIVVLGITNQNPNGNGNVVAARAKVRPRRRDAAYLQTQLLIAQKEEAGIQLQAEEFDLMAAAADLDEIKEVNANCILMANLQQASTSGTQTDKAPVYDSDGSAEVHDYDNCYNNEIFNMFTQEEQYTELLEPIPEPHQVQQNDSNVISEVSSVEQDGGTVEQHPATVEETRAYFESLYNNLAIEVEKVNTVNRKLRETNADLTTELARYKNQEKCFEISQEKYDKLERCYQKSVYQEQCLTKKINALHLSSGKQITTLNEEIANLNNQLSKEKSTVSSLQEEKKRLKSDFKIREDELLDKQIQLENKIKELDNILVKMGQSIQTMHMLSPKPDSFYHTEQKMALGYQNPFYLKQAQQKQQSLYNGKVLLEKHDPPAVYDSEETLELAQESRLKTKQLNKEIKPENYTKINHLSGGFVSQTAKSREELYFSNNSKMANVSKSISIPNEEFSDDTTPKAAKFVRDFTSLAKEADESIAKQNALELEIERLLKEVASQDIMSIVQNPSVADTSNLQTELELTSNSISTTCESKVVTNDKVIAPGMFSIDPRVDNTAKTRSPQSRNNPKNDKVPSTSKSSWLSNNLEKIEENHRNLQSSSNQKHMPSECNNIKLAIWNAKSDVVCTMCKQCLITVNHDVCVLNYVDDMHSSALNKNENVSNVENQKKHKSKVRKPKKVGSKERLASPKPSTPRSCLRWSPTGRIFDLKGKILATSEYVCQSDCSKSDNACTSNPQEPISKRFPNSTFSMTGCQNWLDTLLIPLLSEYKPKDKENHGDNECDI
ncbi:hypothetical protein Tco_0140872 [Tanacetum coccineum]